MSEKIKFTIDGKECFAERGQNILDAATDNGIFIPALCHIRGVKPAGACRLCNVKIAGRLMTACTTPVESGMEIENDIPEVQDLRLAIIEMLFVEGNHFCPACEKSGNCELQALAYRYQMMVPRFPYEFPVKEIDASSPKLIIDHNRCILCKRCIRAFKDENGKNIFAFKKRGHKKLSANLSDEMAQKAMDICPVGAIIRKEKGFNEPIGTRKYDKMPIGSNIERVI